MSRRNGPARKHPPGLIVIPSAVTSRQAAFHQCLARLEKPDGTDVEFSIGASITTNLNRSLREGYGEWVWFLGDDHAFGPDALMRLLDRDVDVVAPLCTLKQYPYTLLTWKAPQTPLMPHEIPADRPVKVWACGSAGMLVRKRVLDAVGDPWFRNSAADVMDEDVQFCKRVGQLGFDVWVDPTVPFGHMGNLTAWPLWNDEAGEWEVHLDLWGAGGRVVLPAPRPTIVAVQQGVRPPRLLDPAE